MRPTEAQTKRLSSRGWRVLVVMACWLLPCQPSTADSLRATQSAFRAIALTVRPSLVRIETIGGSQPKSVIPDKRTKPGNDEGPLPMPAPRNEFVETTGSSFQIADGPTTGIIYSKDGYIITSSFNFVREPLVITVTLADGRRLAADLVARDQVRKIALLKVDASDLPVPSWLEEADVRVGAWAVALGLGFGGDKPSVTAGIVSAVNRMQGLAMQTDAKLGPANYGGPVCDIRGRIMGIAVPMAQRPGELAGVEMYDCGVGFAIPRHRVEKIVSELKTGRSFYRGWLGAQLGRATSQGLPIGRIAEPSPLYDAGIVSGDLLVSVNEKKVTNIRHLMQSLYLIPAGEPVQLRFSRDGEEMDVEVRLARNIELGPLPEPEEQDPDPFYPEDESPEDE